MKLYFKYFRIKKNSEELNGLYGNYLLIRYNCTDKVEITNINQNQYLSTGYIIIIVFACIVLLFSISIVIIIIRRKRQSIDNQNKDNQNINNQNTDNRNINQNQNNQNQNNQNSNNQDIQILTLKNGNDPNII